MKTALIILACVAVVLGIIAYFAVFSGTQVIEPVASSSAQSSSSAPALVLSTSSASSSSTSSTLTTSITPPTSSTSPVFATIFSAPYPMTWSEGEAQLAVTGAGLQDDELTFTVNVQLGGSAECVPIDLRMVTDEEGDMAAPSYPTTANFPLASDGTCLGTASGSYLGQTVTFSVDPTATPFLFTTGGTSNAFFEVATTTTGGLTITVPEESG